MSFVSQKYTSTLLSFSNLFCSIDKKGNYFTDTGSPMYTTEKPGPIFFNRLLG